MKNFEQHLMEKYPDLFYENSEGNLECPCGVWVPEGWEKTVDDLCECITQYTKSTYHTEMEVISKVYYFWNSIANILNWGHAKFLKIFPEYNKWEYNKPYTALVYKIRQKGLKHAKRNKVYPPAVKIDQIKEKFGELRFYYSGGDKQVMGMVRFAEHLCNKTCEVTGEFGILCTRGGWYRTLSPKLLEQDLYKGYKQVSDINN